MIFKTEQKQEKCIIVETKIFSNVFFESLIVNKQIHSNLLNDRNNKSTVSNFRWATYSKPNNELIGMTISFSNNNCYFLLAQWMTQQTRKKKKKPFVLLHAVHDIQHPLLEYMTTVFWSCSNFISKIKNKIISTKKLKNKIKQTMVYKYILNIWQFNNQILVHPWILLVHVPHHTGMYRKKCKPKTQVFYFLITLSRYPMNLLRLTLMLSSTQSCWGLYFPLPSFRIW